LSHKCDKYVDCRRVFMDDISLTSMLFLPAVGHLSVDCVLRLSGGGLHLPLQVRDLLELITCGRVSVPTCVPSI
jgi:hypothetical protein